MTMVSAPAPVMRAPIAFSMVARFVTSGSRAAFTSRVVPRASTAASMTFSVPVTVTVSNTISAPVRRSAFAST